MNDSLTKPFLTIISVHSAILVALHKSLKVENSYKAFRQGESEFYDAYRQLLDVPSRYGDNEKEQLENYFMLVEQIRKNIRSLEIDNFPHVHDINSMDKKE